MTKIKKVRLITRISMAMFILGFTIWILNHYFIFFGKIQTTTDFSEKNYFISNLQGDVSTPLLDIASKKSFQEIKNSDATLDLIIPKDTEKVDISVQTDKTENSFVFNYATLNGENNNIIAWDFNLAELNWPIKKQDDYVIIYDPEYDLPNNLNDLFEDSSNKVFLYQMVDEINKKIVREVELLNKDEQWFDIDLPLRGEHSLEVYVGDDGTLDMKVKYNQKIIAPIDGEKKVGFGAYLYSDEIVEFTKNSKNESDIIEIKETGLKPGKYRLDFKHDNDITFEQIKTHNVFDVMGKMVVNNPNLIVDYFTFTDNLQFYTNHGGGAQDININDEKINLPLKEKVSYDGNEGRLLNIKAEHADFEVYSYVDGTKFYPVGFPSNIYNIIQGGTVNDFSNYNYIIFRATDSFYDYLNSEEKILDDKYSISIKPSEIQIDEDNILSLGLYTNSVDDLDVKIYSVSAIYYRDFLDYFNNKINNN